MIKKGNKVIARHIVLQTGFQKYVGLMLKKKLVDTAYLFDFNKMLYPPALHMWFVFFPIDVVFLDDNFKVVDIKRNFKPWTMYKTNKMIRYFIELPLGDAKSVNVGDKLSIDFD